MRTGMCTPSLPLSLSWLSLTSPRTVGLSFCLSCHICFFGLYRHSIHANLLLWRRTILEPTVWMCRVSLCVGALCARSLRFRFQQLQRAQWQHLKVYSFTCLCAVHAYLHCTSLLTDPFYPYEQVVGACSLSWFTSSNLATSCRGFICAPIHDCTTSTTTASE